MTRVLNLWGPIPRSPKWETEALLIQSFRLVKWIYIGIILMLSLRSSCQVCIVVHIDRAFISDRPVQGRGLVKTKTYTINICHSLYLSWYSAFLEWDSLSHYVSTLSQWVIGSWCLTAMVFQCNSIIKSPSGHAVKSQHPPAYHLRCWYELNPQIS